MNIEYYPKKVAVDRVKFSEPLIAIIDCDGLNAVVAPFIEVETHANLLTKALDEFGSIVDTNLDGYFLIFFDKDIADWSYKLPKNYRNLEEKDDRIKRYYTDGFRAISTFLKDFNFLVGINIPKKFR